MPIVDPADFHAAFDARVRAAAPQLHWGYAKWTSWFGEQMQEIARQEGCHCQNLVAASSGEWLKVDHVFVERDEWDAFPMVAVEHENGELGTRNGRLVQGGAIEWALWKTLAVRCKLAVLVCYPYGDQRTVFFDVVRRVAQGWKQQYGDWPNLLLLVGWWSRPTHQNPSGLPAATGASPYEALTLDRSSGEIVEITGKNPAPIPTP